ncbi:chloride channel protein [Pseudomonadales bacterium]|nr:chloride channel protein [Pseudomonadales bacterium]MDB9867929.1 chloride channel protein [Pseudomonadales bacterium]MDC1308068.1 chloride channel protein [Pseudomonadales bacterium]
MTTLESGAQRVLVDTKNVSLELLTIVFVGCLIGAVMCVVADGFVMGVSAFGQWRAEDTLMVWTLSDGTTIAYGSVVFLWVAAGLVVVLKKILSIQAYAGPADTIYAAQQTLEPLDVKRGIGSTFIAFICASGGASVGQYGPLVHFGGTIGIWLKRLLASSMSHEIFLGCGVAAAISAGFNAPLAGIVFAHEAVLRHFSIRAVAPISIAAISASALDKAWFPSNASFLIDAPMPPLAEILPALILMAPALSLIALIFMLTLRRTQQFAAKVNRPMLLPFVAATLCGVVGIWLPQVLGLGVDSVNQMLGGHYALGLLLVLLIAKILMSSACIGMGLFGGVFSPAIFIGVAAGAFFGQLVESMVVPGFALVAAVAAMAAVSASVIGAPITATLIVLELTQSYELAVAAMITVMICSLVTHRVFSLSFFDRQLLDRGVDLREGREAIAMKQMTVNDIVTQDHIVLDATATGEQVVVLMQQAQLTEAYLCDASGLLMGKAMIHQALTAGDEPVLGHMSVAPLRFFDTDSLTDAMENTRGFVGESIPVVAASGKLVGSVTEGDLFTAVIGLQQKIRAQERS